MFVNAGMVRLKTSSLALKAAESVPQASEAA
jgi:hypothetical protein